MTCNEKAIAPWQALITGTVEYAGEVTSKKGYTKTVIHLTGGPVEYPQFGEIEVKKAPPVELKQGDKIEALCWVNGRAWQDMVFMGLTLIHVKVIAENIAAESEPGELDFLDDSDMDCNDIF